MRNLNIEELKDKIYDYTTEVEYVEKEHLLRQLHLFLNFLESQPISKRILQRIEEDYSEIKNKIPAEDTRQNSKLKQEIINEIKTPDQQGALGYFLINRTFIKERLNNNAYLELVYDWFDNYGDFDQMKEDFNTLVFKPFVDLLNWYITESQSYKAEDYFSEKEISEFSDKLDVLLDDIRLGQEIIFEEIQDLKEQLKSQKKKNWGEIMKGKLFDLTLNKVISMETFSKFVKVITGEDLNLLE